MKTKKADRIFKIRRTVSREVHTYELLEGDAVVTWTIYGVGITPNDRQCWVH